MGTLTYDVDHKLEIDDRILAHLQIVIGTKLRRGESFNFTWVKSAAEGSGRTTIWLDPAISLAYDFLGSKQPTINRAWTEALMTAANSTTGLVLVPEPTAPATSNAQVTQITDAPTAFAAVADPDEPDEAASSTSAG